MESLIGQTGERQLVTVYGCQVDGRSTLLTWSQAQAIKKPSACCRKTARECRPSCQAALWTDERIIDVYLLELTK
jgi:hypothetical protein